MTSRIEARPRRMGAARMIAPLACALLAGQFAAIHGAGAQDLGTLEPKPLPPLAKPDDPNNPAKELFGRKTAPAKLKPEVVGFYAKGCLAGGAGAADQRPHLAGHAALAQPQLGPSDPGAVHRAPVPEGRQGRAGAGSWSATCRSRAAAR